MTFAWWVPCILAAVFWGLNYALSEPVFKRFDFFWALLLYPLFSVGIYATVWFANGAKLKLADYTPTLGDYGLLIAMLATGLIANFLISFSIKSAGASYAAIMEITYPLFTLLFGYLLFRTQIQNLGWFLAGGALIFAGTALIIMKAKG